MKVVLKFVCISIVIWTVAWSLPLFALDKPTHKILNSEAVNTLDLDTFLKRQLGIPGGVNQLFDTKSVEQDVFVYFDPATGEHFGLDPLPRLQHMEVDYIRVKNPDRGVDSHGLASAP